MLIITPFSVRRPETVSEWLNSIGLSEYLTAFLTNGFDNLGFLPMVRRNIKNSKIRFCFNLNFGSPRVLFSAHWWHGAVHDWSDESGPPTQDYSQPQALGTGMRTKTENKQTKNKQKKKKGFFGSAIILFIFFFFCFVFLE